MEQATQVKKPMTTAKPVTKPVTAQPQKQNLNQPKKSKWWLWLILAVVVLGAAVGVYFLIWG